jgi:hypothetical protein
MRTRFRFAGKQPEKWRLMNTLCFFSCTLSAQSRPPGAASSPAHRAAAPHPEPAIRGSPGFMIADGLGAPGPATPAQ